MWNKIKYYVYAFGAGIAAALLIIFRKVDKLPDIKEADKKLDKQIKDIVEKTKKLKEETSVIKEDWYKGE